ncbi:MAG: anthranilate phosphoribosyltransferase, partial [OM182 bacterium]|nr:anthranilate phosphoribosyltransferase [OM182 bacterium]
LDYSHEDAGDIVALNAGAAIYAAGIEGSLVEGVARAQAVLKSGEALIKLEALASFTQAQVH